MKIILLSCLLSCLVFSMARAECGQNELDLLCQPCAAIECGDVAPEVCLDICENPGCYCEPGYLRKAGACVPEEQC